MRVLIVEGVPQLATFFIFFLWFPSHRQQPKCRARGLHQIQRHVRTIHPLPAQLLLLAIQPLLLMESNAASSKIIRPRRRVVWVPISVQNQLPSEDGGAILRYKFPERRAGPQGELRGGGPWFVLRWQKRESTSRRGWYVCNSTCHRLVFCNFPQFLGHNQFDFR